MRSISIPAFAATFGAVYLAVGIVGFAITGFTGWGVNGDDAVLIFEVNPFHNTIHVAVGAISLVGAALAKRSPHVTQGAVVGIGVVYLLAAGVGFAGGFEQLSIDGPLDADNFLHLGTAIVALVVGRVHEVLAQANAQPGV